MVRLFRVSRRVYHSGRGFARLPPRAKPHSSMRRACRDGPAVATRSARSARRRGLGLVEGRQDVGGVALGLDLLPGFGDPSLVDRRGMSGGRRPCTSCRSSASRPTSRRRRRRRGPRRRAGGTAGRTSRGTRACSSAPCGLIPQTSAPRSVIVSLASRNSQASIGAAGRVVGSGRSRRSSSGRAGPRADGSCRSRREGRSRGRGSPAVGMLIVRA